MLRLLRRGGLLWGRLPLLRCRRWLLVWLPRLLGLLWRCSRLLRLRYLWLSLR